MNVIKRKNIETGIAIGLVCAILLSFSHFNAACDNLRESVLRLHILAASDSEEDQQVKLAVRDRLLEYGDEIFDGCTDLESAVEAAKNSTDLLCLAANEVLMENGMKYQAEVSVGEGWFDTREYDDFTLPAGYYDSLIVKLGKAEGKNWWCVIFPTVCLPAASSSELYESAADESANIALSPQKYVVRFKTVELYEEIKRIISSAKGTKTGIYKKK